MALMEVARAATATVAVVVAAAAVEGRAATEVAERAKVGRVTADLVVGKTVMAKAVEPEVAAMVVAALGAVGTVTVDSSVAVLLADLAALEGARAVAKAATLVVGCNERRPSCCTSARLHSPHISVGHRCRSR